MACNCKPAKIEGVEIHCPGCPHGKEQAKAYTSKKRFNWKRFFVLNILVGLSMQPIVYLILSPYMHFYIGLSFPDDMVKWWISGLPIGLFMNICIAFFLYKTMPWMVRQVDKIAPD